jgi:hypothetical protein
MASKRFRKSEELSPLLVRLIKAAEHSGEDAEGRDIRGAAQALREFGQLAEWALPIHGVFVANNEDVSTTVERVAKQHLDWEDARREVREALDAVEVFGQRDPIESAQNHLRAVSDEAYFYAGLAFGVTLANLANDRAGSLNAPWRIANRRRQRF